MSLTMSNMSQSSAPKRSSDEKNGVEASRPHKCKQCDASFRRSTHLREHMNTHTGHRPFKCDQCNKVFSTLSNLNYHLRIHTGLKPYACEHCEWKFSRAADMRKHVRTHTGEKPFKCWCGVAYASSSALNMHRKKAHTTKRPYVCSTCNTGFVERAYLEIHERVHTGVKPFGCDDCGATFTRKFTLKLHQRIHKQEKPHLCAKCGLMFRDFSNMRRHMKVHLNKNSLYEEEDIDSSKKITGKRSSNSDENMALAKSSKNEMLASTEDFNEGSSKFNTLPMEYVNQKNKMVLKRSEKEKQGVTKQTKCDVSVMGETIANMVSSSVDLHSESQVVKGSPQLTSSLSEPADILEDSRDSSPNKLQILGNTTPDVDIEFSEHAADNISSDEEPICDIGGEKEILQGNVLGPNEHGEVEDNHYNEAHYDMTKDSMHALAPFGRGNPNMEVLSFVQTTLYGGKHEYALPTRPRQSDMMSVYHAGSDVTGKGFAQFGNCQSMEMSNCAANPISAHQVITTSSESHSKYTTSSSFQNAPDLNLENVPLGYKESKMKGSFETEHQFGAMATMKCPSSGSALQTALVASPPPPCPTPVEADVNEDIIQDFLAQFSAGRDLFANQSESSFCSVIDTQPEAVDSFKINAAQATSNSTFTRLDTQSPNNREFKATEILHCSVGEPIGASAVQEKSSPSDNSSPVSFFKRLTSDVDQSSTLKPASQNTKIAIQASEKNTSSDSKTDSLSSIKTVSASSDSKINDVPTFPAKSPTFDDTLVHKLIKDCTAQMNKCQHCNEILPNIRLLKKHSKMTHKMKPYLCQICGEDFDRFTLLTLHMKHEGHGQLKHSCTICSKTFHCLSTLKAHYLGHAKHPLHECHTCGKRFCRAPDLRKHVRVHTGERPYSCPDCPRTYMSASSLCMHRKTHLQVKPYMCELCGQGHLEASALHIHYRVHSGHKPFACKQCSLSFSRSHALKLHERCHSGERPHLCAQCGTSFTDQSNLKRHLRIHTGERPYVCKTCDATFNQSSSLKKHMRTHH